MKSYIYSLLLSLLAAQLNGMDEIHTPGLIKTSTHEQASQKTQNNTQSDLFTRPIVFSLEAQALAYIAQSFSTNEELKQVMPENFYEKIVLLRQALERLSKLNNLGDLIGVPLVQDLLLVQALLCSVEHINQERLIKDIMVNASSVGALETIKLFYVHGVPLTTPVSGRDTICHYNSYKRPGSEDSQLKIAKFLLDNGVNIDIRGNLEQTSLMHAVEYNKLALARYLLSNGADVNARDMYGDSPLDSALLNAGSTSSPLIIKLLLEYGAIVPHFIVDDKLTTLEHLQKRLFNYGYSSNPNVAIQEIIDLIKEHQMVHQ